MVSVVVHSLVYLASLVSSESLEIRLKVVISLVIVVMMKNVEMIEVTLYDLAISSSSTFSQVMVEVVLLPLLLVVEVVVLVEVELL